MRMSNDREPKTAKRRRAAATQNETLPTDPVGISTLRSSISVIKKERGGKGRSDDNRLVDLAQQNVKREK